MWSRGWHRRGYERRASDTNLTVCLASGGIIIAATHTPLGIETRELRMGGAT